MAERVAAHVVIQVRMRIDMEQVQARMTAGMRHDRG